jgi:hypothetical protein
VVATKKTPQPKAAPLSVSIRLNPRDHSALLAAAACAGMRPGGLARVLVSFAIQELGKGNPDLDRAIKVSRDAPSQPDGAASVGAGPVTEPDRAIKVSRDRPFPHRPVVRLTNE